MKRSERKITPIGKIGGGQDGAIAGDLLFRFSSRGSGKVYHFPTLEEVCAFDLDRKDEIAPHSNAVTFGALPVVSGDEFPILYTNLYNNYAAEEDRREGTLLGYRIFRTAEGFSSELSQILRIGFASTPLWRSENGKDARPYGNFAVDREKGELIAFVMRDEERKTRFFRFALPRPTDGEPDPVLGIPAVTLGEKDLLGRFDVPYFEYLQGAECRDGKIYSLEGFTDNAAHPARLRVVSLTEKAVVEEIDLAGQGFTIEPEFLSFYGDGAVYSDNKGNIFRIE